MTETKRADENHSADPRTESAEGGHVQEILRAIAAIQFGSVEVTIHDGRVVQIECREKIRLGCDVPRRTPVRPIR